MHPTLDSPERLHLLQHPSDPRLNHVFLCIAQEVAERLQQSHHVSVDCDHNPVKMIAIRALDPEDKSIIIVKPLTEQELEVLQLIADGHNNSVIACNLYISVGAVKTHTRHILRKLCVSDCT